MIFYQLDIATPEDAGEGEDYSEWFASLAEAKRRRAKLIRDDPALEGCRYPDDFAIDRIVLADLPPKELLLAVLNRKGFITSRETVVAAYKPTKSALRKKAKALQEGDG